MSETSSAESGSAEEQEADQPEEFLNRAARRAKGKKQGHSGAPGSGGSQPHGRPAVQANRKQFGNRRTGG
jgi:hypothetical protein